MPKKTQTSGFGVGKREGHDSSAFYNSPMYQELERGSEPGPVSRANLANVEAWADRIFQSTSEVMPLPDNCVALAFTSPPYNATKAYANHSDSLTLPEYLDLIRRVGQEVYRVLLPGGRYLVNISNLGRKPYIPLAAYFYPVHMEIGFLPMGEIIWRKARGASGSCAWGSWMSAKSPRLRDVHEYILVFAKGGFSRPDPGESDISRDEFMESTLSVWEIPPESARRVGHPAPFPVGLAARAIKLYSYKNDVVLDPFNGAGATCVAAKKLGRRYVGFDISEEYCRIAERRLAEI
jgi:site-specific DNA-methyltransferase (adenine-specific)